VKPWLAAAVLAAAWLCASSTRAQSPPAAGDVEEARKHYARGVELYNQGADSAALAELERAYQLAPNWKVLYELGVVELAVHDFAAALRYFERYLDEGQDAVKGARRQEVTADIAQLRQEVATIEVATADGADIKLDDVTVATAPLAKPLLVNAGHHKLGASKDGRVAEARVLSVAGGDHTRVELAIPELAPPPTLAPPPPPAPAPEPVSPAVLPPLEPPRVAREEVAAPRPRMPLWIGGIATGVLATGAVVTGVVALGANSDLTHAKNDGPSSSGTLSNLSSRARAFALASDVMTGTAVVAAGVTLYFVLRSPSHAAGAAPSTSPGLSLGLGLARAELQGRF
jgi:hypothetical protein